MLQGSHFMVYSFKYNMRVNLFNSMCITYYLRATENFIALETKASRHISNNSFSFMSSEHFRLLTQMAIRNSLFENCRSHFGRISFACNWQVELPLVITFCISCYNCKHQIEFLTHNFNLSCCVNAGKWTNFEEKNNNGHRTIQSWASNALYTVYLSIAQLLNRIYLKNGHFRSFADQFPMALLKVIFQFKWSKRTRYLSF